MAEPLGYFLTWATYGTWLPGDDRGWIEYRHGWQLPSPARKLEAEARMTEDACILDTEQRALVDKTIADHCRIRGWQLHAVNCRTNHLHVVVSANLHPDEIRKQFKAWCTRRLKELERQRLGVEEPRSTAPQKNEPRSRVGFVSARIPTRSASEATPATPATPASGAIPAASGFSNEAPIRENWWAERGSRRYINDEVSLEAAVVYVLEGQDLPREH